MSRLIYRVCLIAVLLTAIAGGVYYYTTVYQKEAGPQKGTFVDRTVQEDTETAGQTKEAFAYLSAGKTIPAQAVETGKEADTHGSTGYALFEN